MRANSTGPITTFLMFVPLIAVPLLAVFGIPQFSAVNASPPYEERLALTPPDQAPAGPSGRQDADDVFAPAAGSRRSVASIAETTGGNDPRPSAPFASSADFSKADPFQPGGEGADDPNSRAGAPRANAMSGWALDAERSDTRPENDQGLLQTSSTAAARLDALAERSQNPPPEQGGSPFERPAVRVAAEQQDRSHPADSDSASASAAQSASEQAPDRAASGAGTDRPAPHSSWRDAVRRLNELGIRDYQLQPGVREDEFHFSCWFTPEDNPRQTLRFEAEATEPLRAVEKVIAQIEERFEQR